jgi:hypothetical protein
MCDKGRCLWREQILAQLIPSQPTGDLSLGCIRVFQALKRLPDDWTIWLSMSADPGGSPDFLACHRRTNRCYLFSVINAMKTAVQQEHIAEELERFERFRLDLSATDSLGCIVCHHDLERLSQELESALADARVHFIGRADLRETELESRLLALPVQALKKPEFRELRMRFTPESRIDVSLAKSVAVPLVSHEPPAPMFLDLRQEELTKRDLELSDDAERAVASVELRLLTGVAGSGKTLVLLHRAALLAARSPSAKILVLTFNKPLTQELVHRLKRLDPTGHVQCLNFHSWLGKVWHGQGSWPTIQGPEKDEVVHDIGQEMLGKNSWLLPKLASELDWIHESGIVEWEEYAEADRKGRGFRLTGAQRELFWKANVCWRGFLEQCKRGDYPHFGYRYFLALRAGLNPVDVYDYILVDEAQFFARTWFEAVRRHLKPGGRLFLVADPSQGFLRTGTSWAAAGLDVRGKSDRLTRSYRTTKPILEFAWGFLASRCPELGEDVVQPDMASMVDGPEPRIYTARDLDEQIRIAAKEIAEEIKLGVPASAYLVLISDGLLLKNVISRLRIYSDGVISITGDGLDPTSARVCSLDKATGLEAHTVYVLGASDLLDGEGDPTRSEEDSLALRERNGKRLYMAFTRAASVLRIGWCGAVPVELGVRT